MKKTSHITSPYKAIMIDVDGTLVQGELHATPSLKVERAIKQAQKLDIHVALVTGREYSQIKDIIIQLDLKGLVSSLNGAQILEANTGKVLAENLMTKSAVKEVAKIFTSHGVKFVMNDEGHDVDYDPKGKYERPLGMATFGMSQEKVDKLIPLLSQIPSISYHVFKAWAVWGSGFGIGISDINATKQHGILEVAKILKIDTHEIIGVGDGYNDFPMMMACGLRVAMGNAVPELKEIADYIAPSVDDDGVADVIEKYILNPSQ